MRESSDPGPHRDEQFRHIGAMTSLFLAEGLPVVSVDAKRKEPVGLFKAAGSEWRRSGDPRPVLDHDFTRVRATPYGVYDVGANRGYVRIGVSGDTARFAVASIRAWLLGPGREAHPHADRVLVTCDCGGSNGCNRRMFKKLMADLAAETGVTFLVCHYPPGTSKWNPIEHRMFAPVSKSIQAQPIETVGTLRQLIAHTTTTTGLTIRCDVDEAAYPTGERIPNGEFRTLPWRPQDVSENIKQWNYIIEPPNNQ